MTNKKNMTRLSAELDNEDNDVPYGLNVVVLRGELTSEPVLRELPSGEEVTNLEITTPLEDGRLSVPVVLHASNIELGVGDQVVIVGHVRRRFFRAGVGVQSRTEVLATAVLRARQVARVRRSVEAVLEELAELTV